MNIDFQKLLDHISDGKPQKVFNILLPLLQGVNTEISTALQLASARFNRMKKAHINELSTDEDFRVEFNSIVKSLIKIINDLRELDPKKFIDSASRERIKSEIEDIAEEFDKASSMSNRLAGMRMQVHHARSIAEKLIVWPDLINDYKETTRLAILCGIGRKIKLVPDMNDLSILESLVPFATTNFARQFITNALAELIYSGQLQMGDDIRVRGMLDEMKKNGDVLLIENIERVSIIVDFMTGKLK